MNFFKSILLDDPEPPRPDNSHEPGPNPPIEQTHEDRNSNDVAPDGSSNADAWSFGGLIKTLSTRSESLIETYRKDLEEFGSGLKKETEIIRDVASRAVKDLPASLEAGTSAAHGVLDGVLKSTAEIISKEAEASTSDGDSEPPETNESSNPGRYSWFEAQLSLIQSDSNNFCEEAEDVEEYKKWKLGFQLGEKRDEIEGLIGENGNLEGVYEKVVPSVVDHETFFCRYFYRVDKLKQQDKVRVNLVKRVISVDDDDDELSWDVDDDENKRGDVDKNNKSDVNVKSNNQEKKEEEEDLGWDDIEDTGSDDEKKISTTRPPIRANPIQKLNVEDDDEDLSWDVEDDDNKPVKSWLQQ
ncbi:bsd domain-containing protein 1 [Phtheirospermum japonicum]|uniref:Bsd domain-containing protein 1 n=1 Tax=Phtheirospermum japonicum TaxID=374723 RepID=A0A830BIV6_9LAMI|nr:bsd domain-containing protein 1 [Phtheirospermum japonicum]